MTRWWSRNGFSWGWDLNVWMIGWRLHLCDWEIRIGPLFVIYMSFP